MRTRSLSKCLNNIYIYIGKTNCLPFFFFLDGKEKKAKSDERRVIH